MFCCCCCCFQSETPGLGKATDETCLRSAYLSSPMQEIISNVETGLCIDRCLLWGSKGYVYMYIIVCVFVGMCVTSCCCYCVLLGFLGIDLDGTTMLDNDRLSLPIVRQKRRHTKSRNGCGTCKLRRVKVSFFSFPSCSYLIDRY
jgi:hypothetical protein